VLLGAANLNGALRSVVDPGALLSLSAARPDAGYVVLLQAGGKLLGMWVETLEGVCPIDLDALTAVDEVASEWGSGLMSGMTDDHLVVLDAELLVERVAELRRQVSEH
jgi:chemotaxis signal transduction protein